MIKDALMDTMCELAPKMCTLCTGHGLCERETLLLKEDEK
jgi:hypothetical protein